MPSPELYDTIGATYPVTRCTDPRIATQIGAALGDARTVLNVGAGTGSDEPADCEVTAVEPSALMCAQRPAGAAPCVAASPPFLSGTSPLTPRWLSAPFHWPDPIAGLREMRRVARRVVVFTFDGSDAAWRDRFWLIRDYLPEVTELFAGWPPLSELAAAIDARTEPALIPWDCADGFFEAYWRRPEAYLDDQVRRGMSVWIKIGRDAEQRAMHDLQRDYVSARWAERNHELLHLEAADLGLRLLIV